MRIRKGRKGIIMPSEKSKGQGKGKQTGHAACIKGCEGEGEDFIRKTRILKKREKAQEPAKRALWGKRVVKKIKK
jgi:hypothetical protein